jgi:hypothetical protein
MSPTDVNRSPARRQFSRLSPSSFPYAASGSIAVIDPQNSRLIMNARLLLRVLGVLALVVAALAAIADQSGNFIGVYETPPFLHE